MAKPESNENSMIANSSGIELDDKRTGLPSATAGGVACIIEDRLGGWWSYRDGRVSDVVIDPSDVRGDVRSRGSPTVAVVAAVAGARARRRWAPAQGVVSSATGVCSRRPGLKSKVVIVRGVVPSRVDAGRRQLIAMLKGGIVRAVRVWTGIMRNKSKRGL
jgi:hypothetical protein